MNLLATKISLLLLAASPAVAMAQDLKIVDNKISVNAGATSGITPEWPALDADGNRNPRQALIVIDYDGLPEEEIPKTKILPDLNNPNKRQELKDANGQPLTFLFVSLDDQSLTFNNPTFGSARLNLPRLSNKQIYSTTLQVDKRMNIDIEPLTDFETVKVYLDRSTSKETPARFNNVTLGKHSVMFEMPDGRHETHIINVTAQTEKFNEVTNPELDMRKRMPVKIESSQHNVAVYVDDQKVASQAPYTAMLPAGNHTIRVVNNNNEREFDITTVNLKQGAEQQTVKLKPSERRKFIVTANFSGYTSVPMMLYAGKEEAYKISREHAKGEQRSYEFDLPVGTKYKFRATYQGNEGKRTIKVTPDIAYSQVIDIKKRRKIVWPWDREYSAPPVGLTAAYVQKKYEIKFNGDKLYSGSLVNWDETEGGNGDYLHGLKVGVQYQPTFKFGLGLLTGLFWEYYRSSTDRFDIGDDGLSADFNKYQEHHLTMPVQVFYNFPFASKVALAFHGGIEMDYTLAQSYSGYVEEYNGIRFEDSYNVLKDADDLLPQYPGVFSLYWQVGAQLRLGPVMLGAQISRPITSHKFELDQFEFTTVSIKNSFSLTYVF
ncbi:MAG: DUF4397 domain-containing protein [Muribaculum sp.]|nr:DUF4397 domain-containing protein [Muribaculum sp.]